MKISLVGQLSLKLLRQDEFRFRLYFTFTLIIVDFFSISKYVHYGFEQVGAEWGAFKGFWGTFGA